MKKFLRAETAVVATIVAAFVFALSALFIPTLEKKEAEEEREILVSEESFIAVQTDIKREDGSKGDTAHALGEEFILQFTIQYRHDEVKPDISSLQRTDFSPFELVDTAVAEHEKLDEEISQYTYVIPLATFNAVPGSAYRIDDIHMPYTVLSSGEENIGQIPVPYMFQITAYYGDSENLQHVSLRPPKDLLEDNANTKAGLFALAAALIILLIVTILTSPKYVKNDDEEVIEGSDVEKLLYRISLYKDKTEIENEDPRKQLRELESATTNLAYLMLGIGYNEFWTEDNGKELNSLRDTFKEIYREGQPETMHIVNAAKTAEMFFSTLHDEHEERGR